MSRTRISAPLRAAVARQAHGCCEYCRMPEAGVLFRHQPDHVIAEQHGGATLLANLALACVLGNRWKGANVSSVDPVTRLVVALFNPRADRWEDHFRLDEFHIVPLTAVGRATARLLKFADPEREQARRLMWGGGRYPR